MLQENGKEKPEQSQCQDAALFHSTFDVKRVRCRAVKDHGALHVHLEGSDDAEEPGWTSDFGEDLEKVVPAV